MKKPIAYFCTCSRDMEEEGECCEFCLYETHCDMELDRMKEERRDG